MYGFSSCDMKYNMHKITLASHFYIFLGPRSCLSNGCCTQVTAAAWPAHPAWLEAFLLVLGTKIVHEKPPVLPR